eukprot:2402268-Rhodomonas_salina.3
MTHSISAHDASIAESWDPTQPESSLKRLRPVDLHLQGRLLVLLVNKILAVDQHRPGPAVHTSAPDIA